MAQDAHPLKRQDLSDKLPWRELLVHYAPDVVLNDDGSLMRTFQLYGPDLSGAMEEIRGARMLQANNAVRRLGGGWVLAVESRRWEVPPRVFPPDTFQTPFLQKLYAEAREAFTRPGQHY